MGLSTVIYCLNSKLEEFSFTYRIQFMKKIVTVLLSVVILSGVFAGCGGTKTSLVVTTIPPLEYYLSELLGDWVEVKSIVPAGENPFTYQPTEDNKKLFEEADFVLLNGGDIDTWATEFLKEKETFTLLDAAIERGLTDLTDKEPFVFLNINAMRELALVLAPVLEEKVESSFGVKSTAYEMEVTLATLEDNWWNRFRKHNKKIFSGSNAAWGDIAARMGLVYTNNADDLDIEFFVFEPESELMSDDTELPNVAISIYDFKSENKTYTKYIDSLLMDLYTAFEAN